jgi:hypothetical protein
MRWLELQEHKVSRNPCKSICKVLSRDIIFGNTTSLRFAIDST